VLIVALLVTYLGLGWQARLPLLLGANDEMVYWSLSKSLETGAYREIFQASAPRHVLYPPGYPAWLIVVRHTLGERIDLVPAVNLALVAVSLLVLAIVARPLLGGWLAVGLLLILVLNQSVMIAGGSVLSEGLYLALSAGCLAATLAADRGSSRAAYAAIALALLAFLTRSVGVALVVAIGVWLLARRRRGELVTYAAASAVVVGGWFSYSTLSPHATNVNTYKNDFVSGPRSEQPTAVVSFAQRVRRNAITYGTEILPSEMALPTIPGTLVDNVLWLLLTVALMAAALVGLWSTWRVAAAYLVLYGGILVVWPWPINRYIWAILPLVMFAMLFGALYATRRLPPRVASLGIGTLVALFVAGSAIGTARRVSAGRECDRTNPMASPGCYPDDVRSMLAAADYVRAHGSAGEAVLTIPAAAVNFVSGHLAESAMLVGQLPRGGLPRALRERGIHYVLLTSRSDFERGPLARALLDACTQLRVEARFPLQTLLLTPLEAAATTTNACADLTEYHRVNEEDHGNQR
jgi:hypothetical protein